MPDLGCLHFHSSHLPAPFPLHGLGELVVVVGGCHFNFAPVWALLGCLLNPHQSDRLRGIHHHHTACILQGPDSSCLGGMDHL